MVLLYIFLIHTPCSMFFASDLLLVVHFMFILDYRNDVRQKANLSNFFYSSSKWVIKTTCNIITPLAQELLTDIQCSTGSRSFAKEMRDLKMRSSVASHQKLTTTNWEPSSKLILLQLHEKLPKNSTFDHSTVVCQLKQTGKIKELGSGCLVSWWKNQNNHRFEVLSSLILQSNNKPFLDQIVMCDEKWVLYHNQWQLVFFCISTSGWTRKKLQGTSQSQICTNKKVLLTVWQSAASLTHYSFLNSRKTIISEKYAQQINEMHWKLQHPQLALVNRKGQILLHINAQPDVTQPTLQKLNELDCDVLPHLPYSPFTDYHFFK